MTSTNLFVFLSSSAFVAFLTCHENVQAGFTSGAPCSERNTAYLSPSRPLFPKDPVKCVDLTGMGSTPIFLRQWPIAQADTLYASGMNLTNLIKLRHIFSYMPNLEMIDMTASYVRIVPRKINRLEPRLQKFLLAKNRVKIPSKGPLMCSATLDTLDLSHNSIRQLHVVTFKKLPALRVLYLDSNRLRDLNPKVFAWMENLKYLHLGNNFLKVIPPKAMMPKSLVRYIVKGNAMQNG